MRPRSRYRRTCIAQVIFLFAVCNAVIVCQGTAVPIISPSELAQGAGSTVSAVAANGGGGRSGGTVSPSITITAAAAAAAAADDDDDDDDHGILQEQDSSASSRWQSALGTARLLLLAAQRRMLLQIGSSVSTTLPVPPSSRTQPNKPVPTVTNNSIAAAKTSTKPTAVKPVAIGGSSSSSSAIAGSAAALQAKQQFRGGAATSSQSPPITSPARTAKKDIAEENMPNAPSTRTATAAPAAGAAQSAVAADNAVTSRQSKAAGSAQRRPAAGSAVQQTRKPTTPSIASISSQADAVVAPARIRPSPAKAAAVKVTVGATAANPDIEELASRQLAVTEVMGFVPVDDPSPEAFCVIYPNDPKCVDLYVSRPAAQGSSQQAPQRQQAPQPQPQPLAAPPVALYVSPGTSFESMVEVSLDQQLLQIPQSFMGISHEWTYIEELNNIPGYKDILKMLASYGSGPLIIRVGGGSTDKMNWVQPDYVYDALKEVYYDTGAQYILGLTFETGDIELARNQMNKAKRMLPSDSILSFEIGNEPNFYEGQMGGKTALEYVRCCFNNNWFYYGKSLTCPCGDWNCCDYGQFAGPVWGHINVFPSTMKWFLDMNSKFLDLVTVHWYKATKESYNTPVTLLDEAPIRKEMDNLRALVQTSNSYGKPLRVAEMNTISNSGRVGVSNVFAATLWTLDGAFEVAAAGAVGVNLHQGSGQNLYTGILRWYENGRLSPPVLRPPFYGMLMFQQAVRGGSKLLGKTQVWGDSSYFKVWPLLDVSNEELRIVIINKHPSQAGTQSIRINRSWGYAGPAKVSRLVARGEDPLSATGGVTIGGYYYGLGGVQKGEDRSEYVQMTPDNGMQAWKIYMPPGSAALITLPKTNS